VAGSEGVAENEGVQGRDEPGSNGGQRASRHAPRQREGVSARGESVRSNRRTIASAQQSPYPEQPAQCARRVNVHLRRVEVEAVLTRNAAAHALSARALGRASAALGCASARARDRAVWDGGVRDRVLRKHVRCHAAQEQRVRDAHLRRRRGGGGQGG
jgi:hypothetical protein